MRNLFANSLVFFAVLAAICSCDKGGEKIDTTPLTVSVTSIETNVLQESKTITVDSPRDWKATTTGEKWITITPSSGKAGTTDVKVTVKTNESGNNRNAVISFKTDKEEVPVKVAQKWSHFFKLPCAEYTIGYGGGDIVIDGLPKTGFSIELSTAALSWIKTRGNVLEVAYNEGETSRNTTINITDSRNSQQYKVMLIQESASGISNILALSELLIDDYRCPSNNLTTETDFMYAVDMDATTTSREAKVEFRGEGVQWITIGESTKKIYSGDIVKFDNFVANSTIKIHTHSNSTTKVGETHLIVSGLPIVEITTNDKIVDEPKVDCTFRLFDPKARTDDGDNKNLQYFESLGGIEYRGAGAQRYVKKPYNIKLRDSAGEKREAELLNIRNDNSWILDGMYLDVARMRNRVCFDIWNQFNKPYYVAEKPKAMSGTRGHYVEVFINGEYMGLFILSDRIDRKQYQIDQHVSGTESGYIYKGKGWTSACLLKSCSAPSNSGYVWNSAQIEQEYPAADDGMPNFNYMADVINFVGTSSKEEFSAKFEEVFDVNSVVDAFIFLNMIVADDNIGRNTFWIIRNVKTAPKVIHGLWDLDGTLGRNWDRHKETPEQAYNKYLSGWVIGHGNNGSGNRFHFHERIIQENPANIHKKIYDRWNEIKNGALAPSNFNKIVDAYAEQQLASGAHDREVARWKAIDQEEQPKWNYETVYYDNIESEIEYMKDWWKKRHNVLNSLINGLEH